MERHWLREAREQKKLSQEQVSEMLGLNRATYCRYERGERTPSPAIAGDIGHLMNVPKEKFFWP